MTIKEKALHILERLEGYKKESEDRLENAKVKFSQFIATAEPHQLLKLEDYTEHANIIRYASEIKDYEGKIRTVKYLLEE